VLRGPTVHDESHEATFFELFYDLILVIVFIKVTVTNTTTTNITSKRNK
jgi:low temperature requirement protein LtrA